MFDIGFGELLLIAVVALVVLGPERLPKAARFAGLWVRRARAQWYSVKSELERELEAEELKRRMQDTQAALKQAQARLQDEFGQAQSQLQGELDAAGKQLDAVRREVEDRPQTPDAPATPPQEGSDESRRP
ncbi:hypothetical protein GCM10027400_15050 [Pseudoxanthomonas daejeonensis]|uniref:Sec-independent protein translocase protein TatB n=1 Tax=Pseudoxanthomonas daejeonensis TaxID=266062 RepID=A0ABQ6Z6N1_9GAMM|nr:twin-arginine translocase subunit TatB [Pseudoxanthomonas daejeonensis]